MKSTRYLIVLALGLLACGYTTEQVKESANKEGITTKEITAMSFYDFKVTDINGKEFDFSALKGKRVLVVNTASECGYTPQYKQLQELYEKFGGETFTIIGFPANNFGGQEPGSDQEIASFCEKNYGVSFPMMSKISVKGDDMHPLYKWLTQESLNGVSDGNVRWNFHKFLIDENGKWTKELASGVSPLDEVVLNFAAGK